MQTLQERKGVMTAEDLAAHRTAFVEPISTTYRGHRVYEVPPPTQARRGFNWSQLSSHCVVLVSRGCI